MEPTAAQLHKYNLPDALWLIREVSADIVPVDSLDLTFAGGQVAVDDLGVLSWTKGGLTTTPLLTRDTLGGLVQYLAQTRNVPKAVVSLDYDPGAARNLLLPLDAVAADKAVTLQRQFYYSDEQIQEQILTFLQNKLGDRLGYNYSSTVEYYITQTMAYEHVQQMALWVAYWLLDKRRQAVSGATFMRNKALGLGDERLVNRAQDITTKVGETYTVRESETPDGAGADNFTNLWGDKYGYLTKLQLYVRNRLEKLYGDYSLRDNVIVNSTFYLEKHWRPNQYVDSQRLSGATTDLLLGG